MNLPQVGSNQDSLRDRNMRQPLKNAIEKSRTKLSFTSRKFGWYFISVASIFTGYYSIYSSNPDPHHDGFIYAQAIAVKDGLVPNRDFFAMYGPGGPYIQGLWLQVTSDSLLSLRIFTVLQLILIFMIFSKLLERYFSPAISCVVSLTCLTSGPFRLPWPSILLTLIVLVAIFLVVSSAYKSRIFFIFANVSAAVILTLAFFLRLHAILFLLAILFSFVIGDSSFERKRGRIKIWLVTTFLTFCLVASYLLAVGSLNEYLEQTFGWSSSNFIKAPEFNLSFIGFISWYVVIPIILFGTFSGLTFLANLLNPTNKFSVKIPIYLGTLTAAVFLLVHLSAQQHSISTENQSLSNWPIFEKYLYTHLRNGLGSISAYAVIITIFLMGLSYSKFGSSALRVSTFSDSDKLYLAIALASLPQMYPSIDLNHLWYITPLLVLGSAPLIKFFLGTKSWMSSPLISILSFLMLLNSWSFFEESTASYEYKFRAHVLEGMKSNEKNAKEIDRILLNLQGRTSQTQIDFDCQDGLFAAYSRSYEADSEHFIRWGELGRSSFQNSDSIFNCWASKGTIEQYKLLGFSQKFVIPLSNFKPGLLYSEEELDTSLRRYAVLMERSESLDSK